MVMPSNNTAVLVRQLGRCFPGRIGLLIGPGGWRSPDGNLPYALDNGAFAAYTNGTEWDAKAWLNLLDRASTEAIRPLWAAIPDKVADANATKERWLEWSPFARELGIPCAFVVQDGMTSADVPADADLIFVGGTTKWKWHTLPQWAKTGKRVHVGRVNSLQRLLDCEACGAESADGTGWFRGDIKQTRGLIQYVARTYARQMSLFWPVDGNGTAMDAAKKEYQ